MKRRLGREHRFLALKGSLTRFLGAVGESLACTIEKGEVSGKGRCDRLRRDGKHRERGCVAWLRLVVSRVWRWHRVQIGSTSCHEVKTMVEQSVKADITMVIHIVFLSAKDVV